MALLTINILDKWPDDTIQTIEVPFSNYPQKITIYYVPIPRNANLSFLDIIPYKVDPLKKQFDLIVLRLHQPEINTLKNDKSLIELFCQRFKSKSIFILNWNGKEHKIVHYRSSAKAEIHFTEKLLLKELRHAELLSIVSQPNVLLNEDNDYHYIGPNGSHYRSFLRIGNALYSKDALDAICFWLLPHVHSKPLILLDSGSILSLGLNLPNYCHDCNLLSTPDWFGKIECFKSYNENDTELFRRIIGFKKLISSPFNVLNIFSARGTGRIAERLISICEKAGANFIDNVYLFSLPELCKSTDSFSEDIYCQLPLDFKGLEASCSECSKGSLPLKISERTYTLEISADAKPVSIDRKDAEHALKFFQRYPDSGCFTVHKDQEDGRHHMIDIDVSILLKNEQFKKAFLKKLELFKDANVILAPEHDAAREMATLAKTVLNLPTVLCDHSRLNNLSTESKKLLYNANKILIIDDVVQTGTRLTNYKYYLDNFEIKNKDSQISLLVGVARATGIEYLKGIKDIIFPYDNFACVEEIVLPNWGRDECPWCWEYKKIKELGNTFIGTKLLEDRFNILESRDGLKTNLFLQWNENNREWLKHGQQRTIFGPMDQEIDIFVAIASAIQSMRDNGKLNKNFDKPISKVYAVEKYINGRYYENFIRACILRASHKYDLRSSKIEIEQKKTLTNLLYADHAKPFRSEILFNMAMKKLPVVDLKDELFLGEPGICSFLKQLITKECTI